MVENDIDILYRLRRYLLDMVNNLALLFAAHLTPPAVYRNPFGNERCPAFFPRRLAIEVIRECSHRRRPLSVYLS